VARKAANAETRTEAAAGAAWDALVTVIGGATPSLVPRVAIVSAHPDDEIVGAAGILRRLSLHGGRVHVVQVTDGAPRNDADAHAHGFSSVEAYREARRCELLRALPEAQIRCRDLITLGFSDQAAAYALVPLSRAVAAYLHHNPVDVVLSHAFEGGHPDHDAAAFAVHAAAALLRRTQELPLIVEFTSYHAGPDGIRTGAFLGTPGPETAVLRLSDGERSIKRRARDCFTSQLEVLERFALDTERFRIAPGYAFDRRPHEGRLFYEYFDWGLDGARWETLAAEALRSLRC
jgi:LmbE family N-acetylglucosaminyl deacetylase